MRLGGVGSRIGTGGMVTKLQSAAIATESGAPVVLTTTANARVTYPAMKVILDPRKGTVKVTVRIVDPPAGLGYGEAVTKTLVPALKAVAAALEYAHATPNDLVLITGDITQKGYPVEFKAAGEWMRAMPEPRFVIVGNHDVPYWDALARMFHPWRAFETATGFPAHDGQFCNETVMVRGVVTARGWQARPHQLALAEAGLAGRSALLIAPTGGGKTLAGFLPSLIDLAARGPRKPGQVKKLHTLYISPLKALAVDVARNLEMPIAEMGLDIRVETRTGDTPQNRRQRQRRDPPDVLMTTPEQLALLLSYADSDTFFSGLKAVVLDELHALAPSKRGDQLALCLAQLRRFAPGLRLTGLSATVENPDRLRRYLVPQDGTEEALAELVIGAGGTLPDVSILDSAERIPWSGHSARHAMQEVYDAVCANRLVLIFVNTRSQAEFVFQSLWHLNEDTLPIALHHGSLATEQRRKVEAAMAAGELRAVVCTSTLDLGIDWGDVDLVVNIGAPKGASRLLQRIGRANHRLDDPSRALLVPSNRFEVLECEAAREAALTGTQDGDIDRPGALDVLAQHILGIACAAPFDADTLYRDVISAAPYRELPRDTFDRAVEFVATGGYALRAYDRFARLRKTPEGLWRLAHPSIAQRFRMNVGTIVEAPMLKVKLVRKGGRASRGGRYLGEIEEYFIEQLAPGDTFMFAGHILRFEGIHEQEALASKTKDDTPAIPAYYGGKFPLSTYLAERVRKLGGTTLRSIGQVAKLQTIKDNNEDYVPPREMLRELMQDNKHVASAMRKAHEVCDDSGDVASASILEVFIDETERRTWFLFEATRQEGGNEA